jgi:DNA polymerase-3 subunit epsilon
VNEFLLFIDTEASGLPKDWEKPYSTPDNWPYAVQISWLLFDQEGIKLKEEDHYINDNDFHISEEAWRIHRLRQDFLGINGKSRTKVLEILKQDIDTYKPMLVGHFLRLDLHILGAESYRAGVENPAAASPAYCTMLGTTHMQPNPQFRYLKLGQLYDMLFHKNLENAHDAYYDAAATAACYFELRHKGIIKNENNLSITAL